MVTRLIPEEFFQALHDQRVYPLIDTPAARNTVERMVKTYGRLYPVQGKWPVLDLENGYEVLLNNHPQLVEFTRNGYRGWITLKGFDETYSIDEWFDDFRTQWHLIDSPKIRSKMLGMLPERSSWESSALYKAHASATKYTLSGFLRRIDYGE